MLKRKRSEKVGSVLRGDSSSLGDDHHSKNPYKLAKPNFAHLAKQHPTLLAAYVQVNPLSGKGSIDFMDENAGRALTQALLLEDFHASVEIPKDHLCPPLPNRVNYLCWLSDLIDSSSGIGGHSGVPAILDIGVGPVCVYPILGHALFQWDFIGTDVDSDAVAHCESNLYRNPTFKDHVGVVHVPTSEGLQLRISTEYLPSLHTVQDDSNQQRDAAAASAPSLAYCCSDGSNLRGPILTAFHTMQQGSQLSTADARAVSGMERTITATMCNPPFYDLEEPVRSSSHHACCDALLHVNASRCALQIQPAEHTVCVGSHSEMRTLGGEVAFVCAMIADSLQLRDR
jgi:23S rRNA A1618 N6-methylase RlmF